MQYSTVLIKLRWLLAPLLLLVSLCSFANPTFNIAWSIYAGWMPWDYAQQSGILKKWADKYHININLVQVNDYVESINQYTAGKFAGCVMTNMDALTIPAASGVDSSAIIVGDYSDGNDGIVLKNKSSLKAIKGQRVNLVSLSVSEYLLARALQFQGMSEKDVTLVNTSDSDIVSSFASDDVTATVTWNPMLSVIKDQPNAHEVFSSHMIPGEILDLMVVKTDTVKQHPELAKALTGAWYETMQVMSKNDDKGREARSMMAKASGTDLANYEGQLKTTYMFYSPEKAVALTNNAKLKDTMSRIARFSFDHGLLGDSAPSAQFIGIETPTGVFGDSHNIKMRFNPTFMQLAADGKL
ncbi:putative urea ABC transporter substrate-binding protein [Celerinatantimonas sp. YJH-8]|uniref:putative urea ABC transporter substrate-binding protein n=1 Tax=Celerinatantimonas sp. YJH-8 TaxID=3228714 RepID=UPI0038C8A8A5